MMRRFEMLECICGFKCWAYDELKVHVLYRCVVRHDRQVIEDFHGLSAKLTRPVESSLADSLNRALKASVEILS